MYVKPIITIVVEAIRDLHRILKQFTYRLGGCKEQRARHKKPLLLMQKYSIHNCGF